MFEAKHLNLTSRPTEELEAERDELRLELSIKGKKSPAARELQARILARSRELDSRLKIQDLAS